jgi:hypothetical protein
VFTVKTKGMCVLSRQKRAFALMKQVKLFESLSQALRMQARQ